MKGSGKSVQFGAIIVVIATAILLLALVFGAIDSEQLKTTLTKTILVVGILVLASIGILALASLNNKK